MIFDKDVLGRLVLWIVFVALTDILWVARRGYNYYNANAKNKIACLRPPAWLFGPVWLVLDVLRIAFIFMFVEWTINVSQWSFLLVSIMFVVQELIKKTWAHTFFNLRMPRLALLIVLVLFSMALTITIATPLGDNIGADLVTPDNYKYTLMGFFLIYTLWLFYAFILNFQWAMSSVPDVDSDDMMEQADENEPLILEDTRYQVRHGFKKTK